MFAVATDTSFGVDGATAVAAAGGAEVTAAASMATGSGTSSALTDARTVLKFPRPRRVGLCTTTSLGDAPCVRARPVKPPDATREPTACVDANARMDEAAMENTK